MKKSPKYKNLTLGGAIGAFIGTFLIVFISPMLVTLMEDRFISVPIIGGFWMSHMIWGVVVTLIVLGILYLVKNQRVFDGFMGYIVGIPLAYLISPILIIFVYYFIPIPFLGGAGFMWLTWLFIGAHLILSIVYLAKKKPSGVRRAILYLFLTHTLITAMQFPECDYSPWDVDSRREEMSVTSCECIGIKKGQILQTQCIGIRRNCTREIYNKRNVECRDIRAHRLDNFWSNFGE